MENGNTTPTKRLLVVDDEAYITMTLASVLESFGDAYVVDTVNNSSDVLEKMKECSYDLIITDYRMPGMDGIDLAQAVQEISPQTHIILMTAYSTSELVAQAENLHIDGYLRKPFTVAQVRDMVTSTLNDGQTPDRILIMEDNTDLDRLYKRALTRRGYEVHTASTLEEARTLIERHSFSVFLCDVRVGRQRSTGLLREHATTLQENGTHTIMISGDASFRTDAEALGVDFYLEKPIAIETLTTLISKITVR